MNFIDILYNLVIGPLQLVFEIIYNIAFKLTNHPGLSIIVLSTVMNFLVLPLYKRADEMQEEQRLIEEKLEKGISHIKKTFSGDEKMMILNTYYRQNNYRPTDSLNGAVSLLLQVPFFMAAYNFLANLSLLEGVSFGPIMDLSRPDSLFEIGGFSLNILPILMTLINVISTVIYTKGQPLKSKLMLFLMAGFFLVFLYTSPSGLVFYWTLNNVFALLKNMFHTFKIPGKILSYIASFVSIGIMIFTLIGYPEGSMKKKVFLVALAFLLQIPLIIKKIPKISLKSEKPNYKYIICTGVLASIFLGIYIPSNIIAASPEEFIDVTFFYHPLNYILQSCSIAIGFFVIWVGIFYWLASDNIKLLFEKAMWVLCAVFIVNYLFFGKNLGILLPNLQYEQDMIFTFRENIINIAILLVVVALIFGLGLKFGKHLHRAFVFVMLAFLVMSGINVVKTNNVIAAYSQRIEEYEDEQPYFNLSKEGENVVIIMVDRALGFMMPYILEEKPELVEQFDGFTWYKNTISYGNSTNFGVPGVYGGYEYIPSEMNEREDEKLVDKHNEALKVLPHIYDENGYNVTVLDPSYANYKWIPDLSIYSEYENINTYNTKGMFSDEETIYRNILANNRNFFCFSIMKSLPTIMQPFVYNSSNYLSLSEGVYEYNFQNATSLTTATGIGANFMEAYEVLDKLDRISIVSDDETKNFVIMSNDTAHDAIMLQTPNYEPKIDVDNTDYYEDIKGCYTVDGIELKMEDESHVSHYHVNMATMIKLGEWLEYLKDNDVYDNTKIIFVSDHGAWLDQIDEQIFTIDGAEIDTGRFRPLLMVKDFNAKGFEESDEFMTNADVPTLALDGTIDNPVNPFTGNAINSEYKEKNENYITLSNEWDVLTNCGNVFKPDRWVKVENGDTFNVDNWSYISDVTSNPKESDKD